MSGDVKKSCRACSARSVLRPRRIALGRPIALRPLSLRGLIVLRTRKEGDIVMRAVLIGSVLVMLAASLPVRADDVPQLNVDPVCRGIAKQSANPGEKGSPDLGYSQCVQNEQTMRQKLAGEW